MNTTHTPVPSTQDAKDGLRRIGAEHDAMKMALALICAGVARIERATYINRTVPRFCYFDGHTSFSEYVDDEIIGATWTEIIGAIGWQTCRQALAAARGVV
jgi:hypothetical protein